MCLGLQAAVRGEELTKQRQQPALLLAISYTRYRALLLLPKMLPRAPPAAACRPFVLLLYKV